MTQSDFVLDKLIIKGNTTGKLTTDELLTEPWIPQLRLLFGILITQNSY